MDTKRAWGQPSYQNGYQNPYAPAKTANASVDSKYEEAVQHVITTLEDLSNRSKNLTKAAQKIGTDNDDEVFRNAVRNLISETRAQVKNTDTVIQKLHSMIPGSAAEKRERKRKIDKIQEDLERFNSNFQTLSRTTEDKMKSVPARPPKPHVQAPLISVPYEDETEDDDRTQFIRRHQEVEELDNEVDFMNSIISSRDEEIKTIHGQMIEINDIMKDLSKLVYEQGDMIDNIEANIEDTHQNAITAVREVTAASKYQQSGRKKLCIIAIIFLVIAVVIILVVVAVKVI